MKFYEKYGEKLIGKKECFYEDNLKKLIENKKANNQNNLEKALHVLEYLAQLNSFESLDFLFKGGSAVQILLPNGWQRLSIDIDLCTDNSREEIEKCLNAIYKKFGNEYYQFEFHERNQNKYFLHYKIKIPSYKTDSIQSNILLDIILKEPKYKTQKTALKSFFYSSDLKIKTPTIDSILGDKLSTIGPNTIGRNLKDSRNGLEYVKHFYDIKNLIPHIKNFEDVYDAYKECYDFQVKVRERKKLVIEDCLNDLASVCKIFTLNKQLLEKNKNIIKNFTVVSKNFDSCNKGVKNFIPFLIFENQFTTTAISETTGLTAFISKLLELVYKKEIGCDKATYLIKKTQSFVKSKIESKEIKDYLNEVLKKIEKIPKEERWYIDLKEIIKLSPTTLIYWYYYFYPFDIEKEA